MNGWQDPQQPTPEEWSAFCRSKPHLRAEKYWKNLMRHRLSTMRTSQPVLADIPDHHILAVASLCAAIVAEDMEYDVDVPPA